MCKIIGVHRYYWGITGIVFLVAFLMFATPVQSKKK